MAHADLFTINIDIADMHILTASILYISNEFHNVNVPIHEIFCVSTPPYYKEFFERSYPNVTLNRDAGPFCLQLMNGIQVKKPDGQQWNRLIDAVVTMMKYNKSTIDHAI